MIGDDHFDDQKTNDSLRLSAPIFQRKMKRGLPMKGLQFQIIHQKETKQFDNSFDRYSWRKPHFSTEASSVAMVSIYCLPFLLQIVVNITQSNKFQRDEKSSRIKQDCPFSVYFSKVWWYHSKFKNLGKFWGPEKTKN